MNTAMRKYKRLHCSVSPDTIRCCFWRSLGRWGVVMARTYRVTLTGSEHNGLAALLARGKADVRKLKHVQVLLRADEGEAAEGVGGPGWCDTRIAEAVSVGVATV